MSELKKEEYQNLFNNSENNKDNKNENISKKKSHHYSRFLLQLYQILEEDKYKDIIHWGENGKYFLIENVHDFTEKILPKYYNHNNYSSFVRQLNMYDFHKKKTNSDVQSFQHNKFIKGQKELINTIKRKRRKENITSLIPLNTGLVKYNDNYLYDLNNHYLKKGEKKENLSSDMHSLSLDEEKDNIQLNTDNIEHTLIEYNKKNIIPEVGDQLSSLQLKQNLIPQNNNNSIINNNINNGNKKITKKTIYDLLNCLINNAEDNSKKQKKLNAKIDSLSNKNLEYINKNNSLLDEIKSKIDYNKKFETVVCFILEIQKIKNEGGLKNILISNDINKNNHKNNDLNNLEIINIPESKKEINGIIPANDFLQKKTFNNEIIEPFQAFLNKYMEKNKNRGLLTNSETINNKNSNNKNNLINSKEELINKENKNLLIINGDNKSKETDKGDINNNKSIFKEINLDNNKNRSPSFDFSSSIFNRKRSSSFNSLFSNNTNNFDLNNDFIFKKDIIDNNSKSNNIFLGNNNKNNESYNLNKSFDGDFNQEKSNSLNNSIISYLDLSNKTDKMNDIFGGEGNSINFS